MDKEYLKLDILRRLKPGKEDAITGKILAYRIGERDTRYMRELIKELRQEGHLIGMSVGKPPGYYFIETPAELVECMDRCKSYCIENALTRRDLKRAGHNLLKEKFLADTGQLSLL